MAAVLDVWIAKPGDACLVDDDEWLVRVFDAHGTVFQWAGNIYTDLPAPHAHWAGTIPPGCYVVQAVNAKSGVNTDHVIVTVVEVAVPIALIWYWFTFFRDARRVMHHGSSIKIPPQISRH